MPTITFDQTKTALKNLDAMRTLVKRKEFLRNDFEARKAAYAAILGVRCAANAQRDNKKSLKVNVSEELVLQYYKLLAESPVFDAFVRETEPGEMQRLITQGHGGALEDKLKDYVLRQDKLPGGIPTRYYPKANERVEKLQSRLGELEPGSPQAAELYAEIFRTRRAVSAQRGKGDSLEVAVDPQKYAAMAGLGASDAFQGFVREQGNTLRTTLGKGHGGEAEEQFKDYILKMDHIPANTPGDYMPQALKRAEAIQEKLRGPDFAAAGEERKQALYAELMGTRQAVGAVRGESSSLERSINPQELEKAVNQWKNCKSFQSYLREEESAVNKAAVSGHGGALEDGFKNYVLQMDHLAEDIPEGYLPQALERAEALQEKLGSPDYALFSQEKKLTLYAELLATRSAVGAERGEKDSLKKPINVAALNRDVKLLMEAPAFREYVQDRDMNARRAARTGHGGALGDDFTDYLAKRDILPVNVPAAYMPKAIVRVEVLQQKIKDGESVGSERVDPHDYFAQLLATRDAVKAVRGKKDSLDPAIKPEALNKSVQEWIRCQTLREYLEEHEAEARLAVQKGHGGAFADQFKEYVRELDELPTDVPESCMPTALERTEAVQKKLREEQEEFVPDQERLRSLAAELLAARSSVGAVRGEKSSLDKPMNPETVKKQADALRDCQAMRDYLDPVMNPQYRKDLELISAGHGGKFEDRFKEFVCQRDELEANIPDEYMPTALERTEALQKKLGQTPLEEERKLSLMSQLLGARSAAAAVRGEKESLDKKLRAEELEKRAASFRDDPTFQSFVKDPASGAVEAARKGHGGALEDKFRDYIRRLDKLPEKLPAGYAPTAVERTEALQKRIKSEEYLNRRPEERDSMMVELLAARRAVEAQRGNKESLNQTIPLDKLEAARVELQSSATFHEFLKNNAEAARKAALSGHAGELEDKFKDYVKGLDVLPEDVPKHYMPTALERTEALKKKMESKDFMKQPFGKQEQMYRELLATRMAVKSIRGEKSSLDQRLDAGKLKEARTKLEENEGLSAFFLNRDREKLRKAAASGHGGELEDDFTRDLVRQTTERGCIPKGDQSRYMPKTSEIMEQYRKDLKKLLSNRSAGELQRDSESCKHKIASMMYLAKVESDNQRKTDRHAMLDHDKMEQAVDALAKSPAFEAMFASPNGTRDMMLKAANGALSKIFESFVQAGGNLNAQNQPQPELQKNRQRELNQPVLQN